MPGEGKIYLLHFSEPVGHASHYLGWTEHTAEDRLATHLVGNGSPLVRAAVHRGIEVVIARTWWPATRKDERYLKDLKNSRRQLCPICCGYPPRVRYLEGRCHSVSISRMP